MSDPLRPPERVITSAISKAARRCERLSLRRKALRKRLRELEDQIHEAGRILRDLVRDSTAPEAGDQLTIDDGDLADPATPETVGEL